MKEPYKLGDGVVIDNWFMVPLPVDLLREYHRYSVNRNIVCTKQNGCAISIGHLCNIPIDDYPHCQIEGTLISHTERENSRDWSEMTCGNCGEKVSPIVSSLIGVLNWSDYYENYDY